MNLKALQQYELHFYRAPSAHNAQPWVLRYEEEAIALFFDMDRTLPAGDPTNRDLLLSLGAFVETVLIVAAHFKCDLEFTADWDLTKHRVGSFRKSTQAYKTPFTLEDIQKRQTSRLIYKGDGPDSRVLQDLKVHIDGLDLQILDSTALVDLFKSSDRFIFHNIPVLKELRQWLRLDRADPRYFKDGLTAAGLNLSAAQAIVFDMILKSLENGSGQRLGLDKMLTLFSLNILKKKCQVMVLSGETTGEMSVVNAGRALQKLWLGLAKQGYFTHPLSQIVDCPETYGILCSRIGLKKENRILSVFRVGRSSPPAYSHRLR